MNELTGVGDTTESWVAEENGDGLPDVIPVPGQPGWFDVRVNESYYRCRLATPEGPAECECPHRKHRGAYCKHLIRLEREINGGWPTPAEEAMSRWRQMSEAEKKAVFS